MILATETEQHQNIDNLVETDCLEQHLNDMSLSMEPGPEVSRQ